MVLHNILDSHIHLWPNTSVSPTDHAWMTSGHRLAKGHGIADYICAFTVDSHPSIQPPSPQPSGFVYVETDRHLPTTEPSNITSDTHSEHAEIQALSTWANAPLQELRFLRRIAEETPESGHGFSPGQGALMLGCVIWAPFHLSPKLFNLYLHIAEQVAGPLLWQRVVGFRYLLQGKGADHVERLVTSDDWLENISSLKRGRLGKGWTFDIGVDAHRDGVAVMELIADMVDSIRTLEQDCPEEGSVRFVLNHLCKPAITSPSTPWPYFPRYKAALARLGAAQSVYMKLSGAFNEFEPEPPSQSTEKLLDWLRPYLEHVFENFRSKVVFGSDWPVCNVGGPTREKSWRLWSEVVEKWLETNGSGIEEQESVWWRAGCEVYGIHDGKFLDDDL